FKIPTLMWSIYSGAMWSDCPAYAQRAHLCMPLRVWERYPNELRITVKNRSLMGIKVFLIS
ncbi:MAG: hypothetical protein WCE64_09640, partial [Bacteroidales bacterium]